MSTLVDDEDGAADGNMDYGIDGGVYYDVGWRRLIKWKMAWIMTLKKVWMMTSIATSGSDAKWRRLMK